MNVRLMSYNLLANSLINHTMEPTKKYFPDLVNE
jgi:mRNA deadenylase 3'-5' endonuclease subunit Ccr4